MGYVIVRSKLIVMLWGIEIPTEVNSEFWAAEAYCFCGSGQVKIAFVVNFGHKIMFQCVISIQSKEKT